MVFATTVSPTPAHIYKNFPPSHKVLAASKVQTEPKTEASAPEVQTETPAPVPAQAAPVETANPVTVTVPTVTGCGDNQYASFIYSHESGCNTSALNSIGCYGIGQACPASKLAGCGSDYTCQNAWFTNYANTRYGGWAGAYAFWIAHRWW